MLLARAFSSLDGPPRRFLAFNFFNVLSWQCLMGPALILFGRTLGMPPWWIGLLISFQPLSMVLVVGAVRLVMRHGSKRIMLVTWFLRNLSACAVFLMPWALARGGERAGWYVLAGATFAFCAVRAFGVGGWFPWLHELVSEKQRGTYFSAETQLVHVVNVIIFLSQAFILAGGASLPQFYANQALGVGMGFLSLFLMARIPGGGRSPEAGSARSGLASYREALGNRAFMYFLVTASFCFASVTLVQSTLVMYLRDALKLPAVTIMAIMAVGSLATMAAVGPWGRFADRWGSGLAMFKTLVAHALVALALLALLPGKPWTVPLLVPVVALAVAFGAALMMVAHRAMLGYVRAAGRIGYTNLWIVGTSLAMGLTPIAAGVVIDGWGLGGFELCFALAAATGFVGAVASRWVIDDGPPIEHRLVELLNPAIPLRVLARIVWITLGSDRYDRDPPAGGDVGGATRQDRSD